MTEMKDWSVAFCFEVLGSAEEISVKSLGEGNTYNYCSVPGGGFRVRIG